MKQLQARLGYQFQNVALLEHALTHSSYANEHRSAGVTSNERLEFLGDSVLGMIVGAAFCHNFGLASSGTGSTANGHIAVVLALVVLVVIAVTNTAKAAQNAKVSSSQGK